MKKMIRVLSVLWLAVVLVQGIFDTVSVAEEKKAPASNQVAPGEFLKTAVSGIFDLGSIVLGGKRLASPFSDFVEGSVGSTSVVTGTDIALSGARNLPEAMEEVPGVVLSDIVGNGEEPTLDFRGFSEGQNFVFLLDGVRLNEPKSNNINFPLVPTSLVDRIEISRGGASSLYGEGALGGVANVIGLTPKLPGIHGSIRSLVGGFGEWGENFELSAKDGAAGVFMTGDWYHRRGFRENTSVEKEDFYSKFVWDLAEKNRLSLSYLHAWADLGRSGSIRESLLAARGPEATERPRNFSELETDLGVLDWRFAPLDSVVISANAFARKTSELSVANFATFDTFDNELDLVVDTWGFTAQLDHSKDVLWGFVEGFLVGVDAVENDIDEEDFDRSKATLERLGETVEANSQKDAVGVFSKFSLSWNERVGAYYGIRYDDITFTNNDRINLDNNRPSEVSKISHSAGVSYHWTSELALSGTWSRSFRAPTLADLYANPAFGGNPALKPEEASDYELGVQWKKDTRLLKSSFFLNNRVNEIGFDPNLTDADHLFGQNNNFGKTRRVGAENFVEWKPVARLRLRLNHTYTEAVFRSNTNGGVQISGDHIPMVPRNRLGASLVWQPLDDLDVRLGVIAVAKEVLTNDLTNDANGRRLPAYAVFNLKTVYRFHGWEAAFEIKNLFDERYETGGSLGGGAVLDNFFVPAPGRSYGGSAKYSW